MRGEAARCAPADLARLQAYDHPHIVRSTEQFQLTLQGIPCLCATYACPSAAHSRPGGVVFVCGASL